MKKWFLYYTDTKVPQLVAQIDEDEKVQQVVGQLESEEKGPQVVGELDITQKTPQPVTQIFQIPWGHNREIITKCKTREEALYYVNQTITQY